MSIDALSSPVTVQEPIIQISQVVSAELLSDPLAMNFIRPEMEKKAQIQIQQVVSARIDKLSQSGKQLSYRQVWAGWRPSSFNSVDWSGQEYRVMGLLALKSIKDAGIGDYVHDSPDEFRTNSSVVRIADMNFHLEKVGFNPDPRTFAEGGPANQPLLTWRIWKRIA